MSNWFPERKRNKTTVLGALGTRFNQRDYTGETHLVTEPHSAERIYPSRSTRADRDPGQRILIAGDVLFNNVHVYTAETDSTARGKWLNSLNKIRALKPLVVVPGHSKVGAPLDASTAVDFTENYLLAFEAELKRAKDPDSLIISMKERFPAADFLVALDRGAKANVKP
jgi:hypothetical protein